MCRILSRPWHYLEVKRVADSASGRRTTTSDWECYRKWLTAEWISARVHGLEEKTVNPLMMLEHLCSLSVYLGSPRLETGWNMYGHIFSSVYKPFVSSCLAQTSCRCSIYSTKCCSQWTRNVFSGVGTFFLLEIKNIFVESVIVYFIWIHTVFNNKCWL
jgi:hypothetical protein